MTVFKEKMVDGDVSGCKVLLYITENSVVFCFIFILLGGFFKSPNTSMQLCIRFLLGKKLREMVRKFEGASDSRPGLTERISLLATLQFSCLLCLGSACSQ